MKLASGRVSGVVAQAGSGVPLAEAVVILRWDGGWSSIAHGGTRCVRSFAVKTDTAGRFEIPAWRKTFPDLQDLGFTAAAYAPGWVIATNPWPSKGAVPFRLLGISVGGIEIPPAEIRIEMKRDSEGHQERAKALLDLLFATDCRDGDDVDAKGLYLAVRDEVAAMPPEVRDHRDRPTGRSRLQIIEAYLRPIDDLR